MGGSVGYPTLREVEESKQYSPTRTPVSERPIQPSALQKSCLIGTRIEIVPDNFFTKLFHKVILCVGLYMKDQ